jgi:hypothetical protein
VATALSPGLCQSRHTRQVSHTDLTSDKTFCGKPADVRSASMRAAGACHHRRCSCLNVLTMWLLLAPRNCLKALPRSQLDQSAAGIMASAAGTASTGIGNNSESPSSRASAGADGLRIASRDSAGATSTGSRSSRSSNSLKSEIIFSPSGGGIFEPLHLSDIL